jgi:hypothetical protein
MISIITMIFAGLTFVTALLVLAVTVGSSLRQVWGQAWGYEQMVDTSSFATFFDQMVHEYGWDEEDAPLAEIRELINKFDEENEFDIDPADPLGTNTEGDKA